MKILIVDDEPDMVSSLSRILTARGFEVGSACDGKEAVAMNLEWEPDAVIMDVRMPRLNGIEACLEVQRARAEVLVILMTGFSDALDEANESIFAEAGRNGRVEVMMKPLDLDRVMSLLRAEGDRSFPQLTEDSVTGWLDTVENRSGCPGNTNRPCSRPE
jgi:DNA-binding response OmpR family regulator